MIDPACAEQQTTQFDMRRIMEMIPHRHPFLMIDKVIDVVANEKGLHYVLSIADSGVVWVNTGLNISAEVMKRLDAAVKTK